MSNENFTINTTQNIDLEHVPGSVGERIVAQFIDYLLFFGYFILVTIINGIIGIQGKSMLFFYIPLLFYDLLCEIFFDGQNVGKHVMKLKVVMLDGSQPSFIHYFIRWIFRIIDTLTIGSCAILTIILNGKGQRLGDIAAGTTVIRISSQSPVLPTMLQVPENYQPAYAESIHLTEKDYRILQDIMMLRLDKGITPEIQHLIDRASERFQKKLHVTTLLDNRAFLYALEKDYVYFNRMKSQDL